MSIKHIGITAEEMNDRARLARDEREQRLRIDIIDRIRTNADSGLTSVDVDEMTDKIGEELREAGFGYHPLASREGFRITWL